MDSKKTKRHNALYQKIWKRHTINNSFLPHVPLHWHVTFDKHALLKPCWATSSDTHVILQHLQELCAEPTYPTLHCMKYCSRVRVAGPDKKGESMEGWNQPWVTCEHWVIPTLMSHPGGVCIILWGGTEVFIQGSATQRVPLEVPLTAGFILGKGFCVERSLIADWLRRNPWGNDTVGSCPLVHPHSHRPSTHSHFSFTLILPFP